MKHLRNKLEAGALAVLLAASLPVLADDPNTVSGDKTTDIVVDVLVVRPLGLATTVVGAVLTVAALPFTIPSDSVKKSWQTLVAEPAAYTFKRPMGEFETWD